MTTLRVFQWSFSKPIFDTEKNELDNYSFTSSRPQDIQFRYGSESCDNTVTEKEKEDGKAGQNKEAISEKIKDNDKEKKITSSSVGTDPITDDEYKN